VKLSSEAAETSVSRVMFKSTSELLRDIIGDLCDSDPYIPFGLRELIPSEYRGGADLDDRGSDITAKVDAFREPTKVCL